MAERRRSKDHRRRAKRTKSSSAKPDPSARRRAAGHRSPSSHEAIANRERSRRAGSTRSDRTQKRDKTAKASGTDKAALGKTPNTSSAKDPAWKRVIDWLLEDPSKKRSPDAPPTEREKAVAAVERDEKHARSAYLRGLLPAKLQARLAPPRGPSRLDARAAAGASQGTIVAPKKVHPELDGPGAYVQPAKPDVAADAEPPGPGLVTRTLDRWLGIRRVTDDDGRPLIQSKSEDDWRWRVHRFLRGQSRLLSMVRSTVFTFTLVLLIWGIVFGSTGFNLFDAIKGPDPDDELSQFQIPFFIIESGSMMHPDAPYGRLGTYDPGDVVIIQRIDRERHLEQIQTFYGDGKDEEGGKRGDVIMFLPEPVSDDDQPVPIIHRAMAYVERTERFVPNPDFGRIANAPATLPFVTYTVREFGIIEAAAVDIPQMGLHNYQPRHSGYITQGDNPRSNNHADQSLGVSPFPIKPERIIGKATGEVPYVGLVKIAFQGQDPSLISADEQWCGFLLGKAPCDSWQVFLVLSAALVGGPLSWAIGLLVRRAYLRRLDALALRERQAAEAELEGRLKAERDRAAEGAAATDSEAAGTPGSLRIHSAEDLLSGRVRFAGQRSASGDYASWLAERRRRTHGRS